ncbi:MAG TPA: lmo0937 family membrane protein [Chroococcales cyanobacterium]
MIYTLISLLVLFWVVGLLAHVGGSFIHFLLVLALVAFVYNLLTGRTVAP